MLKYGLMVYLIAIASLSAMATQCEDRANEHRVLMSAVIVGTINPHGAIHNQPVVHVEDDNHDDQSSKKRTFLQAFNSVSIPTSKKTRLDLEG